MSDQQEAERAAAHILNGKLRCAYCGFDFVHFAKPITHYVRDDYDTSNPLQTRGV